MGAHTAAFVGLDERLCSHVVSYGILSCVPVLKIGDTFVPLITRQTAQVGAGEKAGIASHLKLNLKCKGLVFLFIGLGRAAFTRNTETVRASGGTSCFGCQVTNRPREVRYFKAAAFRQFSFSGLFRRLSEINGYGRCGTAHDRTEFPKDYGLPRSLDVEGRLG